MSEDYSSGKELGFCEFVFVTPWSLYLSHYECTQQWQDAKILSMLLECSKCSNFETWKLWNTLLLATLWNFLRLAHIAVWLHIVGPILLVQWKCAWAARNRLVTDVLRQGCNWSHCSKFQPQKRTVMEAAECAGCNCWVAILVLWPFCHLLCLLPKLFHCGIAYLCTLHKSWSHTACTSMKSLLFYSPPPLPFSTYASCR